MKQFETDNLVKIAHLLGTTRALFDAGYSREGVKLAFTQADILPEDIIEDFTKTAEELTINDDMTKEAWWGAVARIGSKVLPKLLSAGKSLATKGRRIGSATAKTKGKLMQGGALSRAAGKAVGVGGGAAGKVTKGLGKKTLQATQGLRQAGRGMRTAPWKTLGGGMFNYGKGALIGGGKGVGGALGKGTLYGGLATTSASMLGSGNRQISQNMRNLPQMSSMSAQPYMRSAGRSIYGGYDAR